MHEIRQSLRALMRAPAFTLSALITLALGIGAAGAIFAIVSAVVLRPLPFPRPDRLVQVLETTQITPEGGPIARSKLERFRRQSQAIEALAGYEVSARFIRIGSSSERVMVVQAEPDFFRVLGTRPMAGRTFEAGDAAGIVLGETFWRRHLGGARDAIGRTLTLNDAPHVVVGIMPASFQFPFGAGSLLAGAAAESRTDIWMPLPRSADGTLRGRLRAVGRLNDGAAIGMAAGELAAVSATIPTPPEAGPRGVRVVPLEDAAASPEIRRSIGLLFAAAVLVLVVACANVANLSFVRVLRRSRELAVREALGATRGQLARLLVGESGIVAAAGGAVGLAVAWFGLRAVGPLAEPRLPRGWNIGVDWTVAAFFLAACAVTAAAIGIASAAILPRRRSRMLDAGGARATGSRGQRRMRDALVVVQVGLAFLLTLGATVLIRELVRLQRTDPGMATQNVLTMHLGQPTASVDVQQFYEIESRVAGLPGVRAAGLTQLIPLQNWSWTSSSTDFFIDGGAPASGAPFSIELRFVSPGYFGTLDIPIVKGRPFDVRDTRDSPGVIAINETLARRYFGDRDPVGLRMNRGLIVGVVGDVRQVHLDKPAMPEIYTPIAQNWSQVGELGTSLLVRADGAPASVARAVRAAVLDVNPRLAVFNVATMDEIRAESLTDFRLYLGLLTAFAAIALVLAAVGTYGVIAHLAHARAREWAIRTALGADRRRIAGLVVGPAVRLTAIGLAVGLLASLLASPVLRGLSVTVRSPTAAIVAAVGLFTALLALAACAWPVRGAWSVDPSAALKED